MDQNCPYRLIYSLPDQSPLEMGLDFGEYIIGRSNECDIVLQDLEVSRRHARLCVEPDGSLKLADLGSANGTQLEGSPLPPRRETPFEPGDTFRVGPFRILLARVSAIPSAGRPGAPQAQPAPEFPTGEDERTVVPGTDEKLANAARIAAAEQKVLHLQIQHPSLPVRDFVLMDGSWKLGRGQNCDILIDDPFVSRHHAQITVSGTLVQVTDPGSSNGITINDNRIEKDQPITLSPGAKFQIGLYTFCLQSIPHSQIGGKQVICGPGGPLPSAEGRPDASAEEDSKPLNLLGLEKISIGRAADNHIVIDHPMVSRYHTLIERMGTRFRILDTHSANGVYVNGERIQNTGWLKEGDEIKVGPYQFNFTGTMIQKSAAEGYTIDVVNLKKYVTKTLNLLQEINLHIGQNEFVALVGMSGSGKTTLQDAINGYRPATHGKVLVNDVDLYQNYDMFRNDIGYVPQRDIVHMELTPEMALDYAAQLRMPADTTAKERKAAVHQTLVDLGLVERKDIPNSRLSGGQLKRVSIGVELLTRPKLFFLDEPTSGLDPGTEYEMMKLLRRLADQGRTIMLITHATKNVMLCDKVIILAKGGHLAYFGAPENALEYFDRHRTRRERLEKDMEFDDIYRVLEDPSKGKPEEWGQRFREESARKAVMSTEHVERSQTAQKVQKSRIQRVSGLKQFFILSARNTKILLKDKVSLVMLLALAPILGIFNIVWGSHLFDPVNGDVSRVMAMWFMAAVVAVLVGSMSSVREVVKELEIYKRERAVGLKVLPYALSKLWVGIILSLYAGAVILFFIVILVKPTIPNTMAYLTLFITNSLGIFAGYLMGLVISSFVPNQNSAMIMLIAVLVPQLLLAGVLIPLENIPGGQQISTVVSTRWVFEAFVRSTGIGDPLVNDPCWELDKDTRLAMDEDEKTDCTCLGPNIFERCNGMPGILSADFYDEPAKAALAQVEPLKPVEPTSMPSPTPIPSPTPQPSPTPNPTPTDIPMEYGADMQAYMDEVSQQKSDYFDERIAQLDDYQQQVKDVTSDWADAQSAQMEDYAGQSKTQFTTYADEMEVYGDDLASWEKERQSAIGAAESLLNTIYDNYGRSFKRSVAYRWVILGVISAVLFLLMLFFIKRKDVI
jgi:ABC-type multidrug transport system ATPase subunit/pSer/pThr/pTyr-binding forkhead associated (FHA) protein